jgi:SAM-dependent methyltransferase/uncharacterized protein YbaR (Trm112 family)
MSFWHLLKKGKFVNINVLDRLVCPQPSAGSQCGGFMLLSESAVKIKISRHQKDEILEGVLVCKKCDSTFPIICGVLLLIPELRSYLAEQYSNIVTATIPYGMSSEMRDYLHATGAHLHSPGATFTSWDSPAGLSAYIGAHYDSDFIETWLARMLRLPAGAATFYDRLVQIAEPALSSRGLFVDIGCNVGGLSWRLAERGHFVYGMDLSYKAVLTARRILKCHPDRLCSYPVFSVGTSYRNRTLTIPKTYDNLEFFVGSAAFMPFKPGSIDLAACLNMLELVREPSLLVDEIIKLLKSDGHLLVVDPYNWRPDRTPMDQWLGVGADSSAAVQKLLSRQCEIICHDPGLLWILRYYERYYQLWSTDCFLARKR